MRLISEIGWEKDLDQLPWQSWTPTVTAAAGSFTSVTNNGCEYVIIGKICFYKVDISIVTKGTADGDTRLTPPVAVRSGTWFWDSGREVNTSGHFQLLGCRNSEIIIWNYDNTFSGLSGRRLVGGGFFEVA